MKIRLATMTAILLSIVSIGITHAETIEDEALQWLTEFIGVDTVNPPGNESRAVAFYGGLLDREGIPWDSAESSPGRGNIWARLEGGDEPALILIQHTDVVPADADYWDSDPMKATERDGYLYGRGVLDMKGTGISQFATFVALKRSARSLNRDVVFVATADEEAGGAYGAGWLVKHRPEIFQGAGYLLNEGGSGTPVGDTTVFSVEVTQKVPVWFRLTAIGVPGHGSMPRAENAVNTLMDGIAAIRNNPFPIRVIAPMDAYFKGLARSMEGEQKARYMNMAGALRDVAAQRKLQEESASHHALTRDTCTVTRLSASNKINTVPPVAWAEMDCRMLPDRPSADLVADINALLEGTGVSAEVLMAFTPAVSATNTVLFDAIRRITSERHPGSYVIPGVTTGFTDSHFFRDLGITSYGFDPLVMPSEDEAGFHGNNERLNIGAWKRGVSDTRAIVEMVVYD
ncbi:MAG: M20/M25/M40 family metallo-hydrolase [Halieaceae bacterium]|jgi:acetylornithine deacetylase/succinyl-diaminopimelate desuccinylase-like protein|nr:M20/M25/M40 family metallo-hydrolase [Halieaceae bacterium]